ncbi:DUF2975 domain-containing protein [Nocardiopsis dassonvillei]
MSRWYRVRWSRADSLVLQGVLVIGILFTSLGTVVALAWTLGLLPAGSGVISDTITVWVPEDAPEPRVDVATASGDYGTAAVGTMQLTFHDPTVGERLLLAVPGLLSVAAVLVVMVTLLGLLRSLDLGDPFVPVNVRRVRTIALTVLGAAVVLPLTRMVCEGLLQTRALHTDGFAFALGVPGGNGFSFTLVFVGLVVAALAEVFRRGTRLREDVEGLV